MKIWKKTNLMIKKRIERIMEYLWNSCLKDEICIRFWWQIHKCSMNLGNLRFIRLFCETECDLQGAALEGSDWWINRTLSTCSIIKVLSSQFWLNYINTNHQTDLPGRDPFDDANPSNKSTSWTVAVLGLAIGNISLKPRNSIYKNRICPINSGFENVATCYLYWRNRFQV